MDLSVVIVNWNTRDLLEGCLQHVFGTVQGIDFEVCLVDNGSTDGSLDMVRGNFPVVRIIANETNLGFARANNQAIRASHGKYVLLLNSDAFLQQDTVASLLEFLRREPKTGICGARLVNPDGSPQHSFGPLPSLTTEIASLFGFDKISKPIGKKVLREDVRSQPFEVGYVSGAFMAVRRQMLEEIGDLDERFFFFSEEIDLCRRAHQAGWKVFHHPGLKVIHVVGGSTGLTSKRIMMLYKGKLQYLSKHMNPRSARILLSFMRLSSYCKYSFYSFRTRLLHVQDKRSHLWKEVISGLNTLSL